MLRERVEPTMRLCGAGADEFHATATTATHRRVFVNRVGGDPDYCSRGAYKAGSAAERRLSQHQCQMHQQARE